MLTFTSSRQAVLCLCFLAAAFVFDGVYYNRFDTKNTIGRLNEAGFNTSRNTNTISSIGSTGPLSFLNTDLPQAEHAPAPPPAQSSMEPTTDSIRDPLLEEAAATAIEGNIHAGEQLGQPMTEAEPSIQEVHWADNASEESDAGDHMDATDESTSDLPSSMEPVMEEVVLHSDSADAEQLPSVEPTAAEDACALVPSVEPPVGKDAAVLGQDNGCSQQEEGNEERSKAAPSYVTRMTSSISQAVSDTMQAAAALRQDQSPLSDIRLGLASAAAKLQSQGQATWQWLHSGAATQGVKMSMLNMQTWSGCYHVAAKQWVAEMAAAAKEMMRYEKLHKDVKASLVAVPALLMQRIQAGMGAAQQMLVSGQLLDVITSTSKQVHSVLKSQARREVETVVRVVRSFRSVDDMQALAAETSAEFRKYADTCWHYIQLLPSALSMHASTSTQDVSASSVEQEPVVNGLGKESEAQREDISHLQEQVQTGAELTATEPEVEAEAKLVLEEPAVGDVLDVEVQAETETGVQTKPEVQVESDTEVQVDTETKVQVQTESGLQAQPEVKVETEAEVQVQVEEQVKTEAEAQVEADTGEQVQVGKQVETEAEVQVGAEAGEEVQLEEQVETKAEVQAAADMLFQERALGKVLSIVRGARSSAVWQHLGDAVAVMAVVAALAFYLRAMLMSQVAAGSRFRLPRSSTSQPATPAPQAPILGASPICTEVQDDTAVVAITHAKPADGADDAIGLDKDLEDDNAPPAPLSAIRSPSQMMSAVTGLLSSAGKAVMSSAGKHLASPFPKSKLDVDNDEKEQEVEAEEEQEVEAEEDEQVEVDEEQEPVASIAAPRSSLKAKAVSSRRHSSIPMPPSTPKNGEMPVKSMRRTPARAGKAASQVKDADRETYLADVLPARRSGRGRMSLA